jgi:hypothetical protein
MPNYANAKRHSIYRQLVASTLGLAGLDAVALPMRSFKTLVEAMADESEPQPDVALPGFYVKVSAALSAERVGPALDSAAQSADLRGDGVLPVVISHRRSHGVSDSLVTVRLADFAKLAGQLAGVDAT